MKRSKRKREKLNEMQKLIVNIDIEATVILPNGEVNTRSRTV